jgi:type VI secretion system protein ImpH
MAAPGGEAAPDLIQELEREPWGFSFFQALRLLEQASPDAARLGQLGPAAAEAVRLRPSSSLAFQAADITAIERRPDDGGPGWQLTTTVLGLYGANSPLPSFYSEAILRAELVEDADPVRVFLDVLNHRLLSLLYAAWAKYRWAFTFEPGALDRTSQRFLGFLGLATDGLRDAIGVPASRLLRYAGTLSLRPRGAAVVAGVLSDFFGGVPVGIAQCVPRWVPIHLDDQNRIGTRCTTLGHDLTLGESVRDQMGKCRVEIGPVDLATFELFLPQGPNSGDLAALSALLLQDPLEWDVRLGVHGPEVPECRMASDGTAVRLGWTSWLRSEPESPDKGELFYAPDLPRTSIAWTQ